MHNLTKASNVRGYSPVGVIGAPFDPAGFVGPSGSESAPAAGRSYIVRGADLLLSVAGGQGGRVVLRDGEGRPFVETEAALVGQLLPVGWALSFEGFAAPPFTMPRLCALLLEPRRHYRTRAKFTNACAKLLQSMRTRYAAAEKDATKLLETGEVPRDKSLDPTSHAAWTQLSATLLASDLALMMF